MKQNLCLIIFFLFVGLTLSSCKKMSCAGIMTFPRCAKFCTHGAVATCEASVHRSIDQGLSDFKRDLNRNNDHSHEPGIYEQTYGCPMSNPGCKN